jgi:RND family efflux transporter MFP subunit
VVVARVQSDLGFRVPGKVVQRLVDRGEVVHAGQPLMRLDPTDFDHAVTAQVAAVASAQAGLVQAEADAARDARLVSSGSVSEQTYIDSRSAADASRAQLAAAEAQLKIARDNQSYTTLYADSDGVIADYLVDPGQVVAPGQVVVQLAHAGPREARVDLPEGIRPAIGSAAQAELYADASSPGTAVLRDLSDAADPVTRTYAARYVLQGGAAQAPLGATVTIYLPDDLMVGAVAIPISAAYDPGSAPGVWLYDKTTSAVSFQPISEAGIGAETITVSHGLSIGQTIIALGANLLYQGEKVRIAPDQGAAP